MTKKIASIALLIVITALTAAFALAQTRSSRAAELESLVLQLNFVDKETDDAGWTKFKLAVTNRTSIPDSLWQTISTPCGKNQTSSRTWVEIFGSPDDKRLGGFCGFRRSEDLGHLWFAVRPGEKGPPCAYLVMTDLQTGRKYISNRVCSRSFTVVRGLKAGDSSSAVVKHKHEEWIEISSVNNQSGRANTRNGDVVFNSSRGQTLPSGDSGGPSTSLKGDSGNPGVSRDQMAALILRAMGETNPPRPSSQRFADVPPTSPFYATIDRVAALGIVEGCRRNKFCPAEQVAREQLAAVIVRAMGTTNPPAPATQRFADVPPESPFYAFIDLASGRELMSGCSRNNFCPKKSVTREEAAAALRKALSVKSN